MFLTSMTRSNWFANLDSRSQR